MVWWGSLPFLRTGMNPVRNFTAAAAAKINPRASIPTTASTEPGLNFSVSKSIAPENNRASASTGVMSLNWMPGLGKSGMLRMACSISLGVAVVWDMASVVFFLGAFEFLDHFAEFSQREILDLADALARDAEFPADFLERLFRAAVEAEAVAQNGRFTRVEMLDHVLQHAGDGFVFQIFVGRGGVFILDDVGKIIRLVIADGRVERCGADGGQPHLPDAGGGHVEFVGQLLVGRFAAKLLLQTHPNAAHLGNFVHQMHRQADGLGLIGERAFDGLLDPPRTVGRKLAALFRIKALDGLHQADVASADQIQQRQSDAIVIARDFYDQAEVGLDHQLARFFVALFNARGQLDFLLRREQFHLPDFAQVKFDGRVAVVSRTIPPDELRGVTFTGRFRRDERWNGRRNGHGCAFFRAAGGDRWPGCAPFGFDCFAFLPFYRHKTKETLRA